MRWRIVVVDNWWLLAVGSWRWKGWCWCLVAMGGWRFWWWRHYHRNVVSLALRCFLKDCLKVLIFVQAFNVDGRTLKSLLPEYTNFLRPYSVYGLAKTRFPSCLDARLWTTLLSWVLWCIVSSTRICRTCMSICNSWSALIGRIESLHSLYRSSVGYIDGLA